MEFFFFDVFVVRLCCSCLSTMMFCRPTLLFLSFDVAKVRVFRAPFQTFFLKKLSVDATAAPICDKRRSCPRMLSQEACGDGMTITKQKNSCQRQSFFTRFRVAP